MSYDAPFAGLKVVDLSQGIAGPYCAELLAQNGANVIKVEPTGGGDWSRTLGRVYGDNTAYSIPANIGKRSVAIDLKSDEGKAVLWRLIQDADVFLEGFRSGVIARLGFGYDAVAAREPGIIYLSISGFGQSGPFAERPAMDPVLQAYTGLMAENKGDDGIPHRVPVIPIDMSCGLYAFQAVSAALYARRDEPRGRYIEASLMQAGAGLQAVRMIGSYLEGGGVIPGAAPSGVFYAADAAVNITVVRPNEWVALCQVIGMPELVEDARFIDRDTRWDNQEALLAIIRPVIAAMKFADLAERLTGARIMYERLNSYAEFLHSEQVNAVEAIAWLNVPHVPQPVPVPNIIGLPPIRNGMPRAHAPTLGEHTAAVLGEHGYSDAEIADLATREIIGLQRNAA